MGLGNAHTRTTLWLGNDDGGRGGLHGLGFVVGTEDNMVSITAYLERDNGAELEVFIQRDLFPQIREAMKRIDERFKECGSRSERGSSYMYGFKTRG